MEEEETDEKNMYKQNQGAGSGKEREVTKEKIQRGFCYGEKSRQMTEWTGWGKRGRKGT